MWLPFPSNDCLSQVNTITFTVFLLQGQQLTLNLPNVKSPPDNRLWSRDSRGRQIGNMHENSMRLHHRQGFVLLIQKHCCYPVNALFICLFTLMKGKWAESLETACGVAPRHFHLVCAATVTSAWPSFVRYSFEVQLYWLPRDLVRTSGPPNTNLLRLQ